MAFRLGKYNDIEHNNNVLLRVIMPNVIYAKFNKIGFYDECQYVECCGTPILCKLCIGPIS